MDDRAEALIARAIAEFDQANADLDALVARARGALERGQPDAVVFGVGVEVDYLRLAARGVPAEHLAVAAAIRLARLTPAD